MLGRLTCACWGGGLNREVTLGYHLCGLYGIQAVRVAGLTLEECEWRAKRPRGAPAGPAAPGDAAALAGAVLRPLLQIYLVTQGGGQAGRVVASICIWLSVSTETTPREPRSISPRAFGTSGCKIIVQNGWFESLGGKID